MQNTLNYFNSSNTIQNQEDLAWRRKRRLEDFLAEERERLQNFLFEESPTSDEYERGNKDGEVDREQEGGGRAAKVFEKEAETLLVWNPDDDDTQFGGESNKTVHIQKEEREESLEQIRRQGDVVHSNDQVDIKRGLGAFPMLLKDPNETILTKKGSEVSSDAKPGLAEAHIGKSGSILEEEEKQMDDTDPEEKSAVEERLRRVAEECQKDKKFLIKVFDVR